MEVLSLGRETDTKREYFFGQLFGSATGILCIAFKSEREKRFSEEFYKYPDEIEIVTKRINEKIYGNNIYFCSQLLSEKHRVKETVEYTTNAWADLDKCFPEKMLLLPSIVLETSPDKYQAFWVLDNIDYDPDDVEELSRRVAYKHREDGVDNGWALTKLLRVPWTYNYKYVEPKVVKATLSERIYSAKDFDIYPTTDEYIKVDLPVPELDVSLRAEDILEHNKNNANDLIWALFNDPPMEGADWSKRLWRLILLLQESGFTNEEVYTISKAAACNKYARDGRPTAQLWKDVVRARVKADLSKKILSDTTQHPTILLSDEERVILESAPPTFIERYIKWASGLTDAASQYHQAGAIIALSSVLSSSVSLPVTYGTIIPNLWVMILGDTTVTRKTTAMSLTMELLEKVSDEFVLATDGSMEGLLGAMSTRPGRSSMFHRDEFSGLLEQIVKKDYMAGMAETLTKLYDCKMQKRVLKSGTVEVKNPRLIIYAGGIRNSVTSILSNVHISSGFIPRFIFITASNEDSKRRPLGPPTEEDIEARTRIQMELQNIYEHYNQTVDIVAPSGGIIHEKVKFEATMTDDAWRRYNKLYDKMIDEGLKGEDPDIAVAMNDRLSTSILKTALLIAASRQYSTDGIIVETIDILRAAKYGEDWASYAKIICNNIGKGTTERKLDKIMNKINKSPDGIPKSTLMQHMHLSAQEAAFILETLKQRESIVIRKSGRGDLIISTENQRLNR